MYEKLFQYVFVTNVCKNPRQWFIKKEERRYVYVTNSKDLEHVNYVRPLVETVYLTSCPLNQY